MSSVRLLAFLTGFLLITGGLAGQDKGPKKEEANKESKKAEAPSKVKGQLPQNWGKLGLTDDQRQKVYTIQAKYGAEIDKLEAQIRELKEKMARERLDVLTEEQKKRLQEITKTKAGGG